MEAAFAELPLALFTTLAPVGAGAFVALALAFTTTAFGDEQVKRIDRMTIIPLVVVLIGFAASFAHLASPMHAPGVFAGVGPSPLSNEILVGSVFVILALVYTIVALAGKLSPAVRKGFIVVVAVVAVVFAWFTGMAYLMDTISSWNTPFVPIQLLGFSLAGGMPLGILVLGLAGSLDDALKGAFRKACAVVAVVGALLAVIGLCAQIAMVSTLVNPLVVGADLVAGVTVWVALAVICLVVATVATAVALAGKNPVALATVASIVAVVGILVARLVFYVVQMSVGL